MHSFRLLGVAGIALIAFVCSFFSNIEASIQVGLPVLAKTGNTSTYATSTGSLTSGNIASWDASGNIIDGGVAATPLRVVSFTYGTVGTAISTGEMLGLNPTVNYSCTINRIDISGYPSGSVTVDVWKAAGAIPTSGNKISASAPMTLSSARLAQNGSRTGWTNSVSSGDVFGFSVASATTVEVILGQIWCQ